MVFKSINRVSEKKRIKAIMASAMVIAVSGMMQNVQASPVTWYLDGVTFSDGGTATGSFIYDADSPGTLQSWDITTSPGTLGFGRSYTPGTSRVGFVGEFTYGSINLDICLSSSGCGPADHLEFSFDWNALQAMSGVSNVIPFNPSGQAYSYEEIGRGSSTNVLRQITGGSFTTTVVPIPSAVWLFGSGLLGLIGIARRKKV